MRLDRHELHALRELKDQYGWPTQKIANKAIQHRLNIKYAFENQYIVCCIEAPDILAVGITNCGPRDKYKERIGRMIAFGRAVEDYFKPAFSLSGDDLEDIARGGHEFIENKE